MRDPSPELWRAAAEASQDAVFELDRDGLIATWTATAARLFGYPSERAVGQPSSILTPQERGCA